MDALAGVVNPTEFAVKNRKSAVGMGVLDIATLSENISSHLKSTNYGGVTLFEHANYAGGSKRLPVGDYPDPTTMGFPNDTLSSLKVSPGFSVTLYQHSNYGGASKTYTSDSSYVGNDFNDQASSMKVVRSAGTTCTSSDMALQLQQTPYYQIFEGTADAMKDNNGTGLVLVPLEMELFTKEFEMIAKLMGGK